MLLLLYTLGCYDKEGLLPQRMQMKIPRYNVSDRKIHGCKKGTFAYYHEYRHKTQHDKDWFSKFIMYFRYPSFIVGGYYWGNKGFDIYALFLLIPIIFFVYVELDAHIYAYKKWRSLKNET